MKTKIAKVSVIDIRGALQTKKDFERVAEIKRERLFLKQVRKMALENRKESTL